MAEEKVLEMHFDPNTISHLGIQMYSTLPPVIAELVSNAYDADAHKVTIDLNDNDLSNMTISIEDDGHGMNFDEINTCFLLIGRNRRGTDGKNQKTRSGNRYVIGKKGIGKLAFFGVAKTIEITTVSNGLLNTFVMDWGTLKRSKSVYRPDIIKKDEKTELHNGTKIVLSNIERKSGFVPKQIATSLAKTFSIFDKHDFYVVIRHNSSSEISVEDKLRFENIAEYKTWYFPFADNDFKYDYQYKDKIKGKIIASKRTVPENMRGVALFSRGKLVNEHSFFDVTATSFGYSYLTGWLDVDFIDEWEPDVISTNRQSLNWEDERCAELKRYIENVIVFIYKQHKENLEQDKKKNIKDKTGIDIDLWIKELPKHDKTLAKKLVNTVLSNEGIDNDKAAELTGFIKDSFQFTTFKELAKEMSEETVSDRNLIELLKEWKIIEAREMYKLAEVRIQTIKKFQKFIETDAKEVPVMHDFFVQFPWLLDPRIMSFKDEVRYSTLLKKHFKENVNVPEKDRRLDFLCHNFVEQLFIIELKRPSKVLGSKELDQALDYTAFVRRHIGNENINNISCYLIGASLSKEDTVQLKADSYKKNGTVIVKTYDELLSAAMSYHTEFIEQYNRLNKLQ